MNPWLMLWARQIHFPFSGSVAQRIDPQTIWNTLLPGAGNQAVERKVVEDEASYGRQLGWLADVLLDIAERQAPTSADGLQALTELRQLKTKIKRLKKAQ